MNARAYAGRRRPPQPRAQEAEVFRHRQRGAARARAAAGPARAVRALADNRRLWSAVIDLVRDPANALPVELRAAIVSVGLAVQREMEREQPNFDFLIAVNENIAAGLSGGPSMSTAA